jgi:hypothetical protein
MWRPPPTHSRDAQARSHRQHRKPAVPHKLPHAREAADRYAVTSRRANVADAAAIATTM